MDDEAPSPLPFFSKKTDSLDRRASRPGLDFWMIQRILFSVRTQRIPLYPSSPNSNPLTLLPNPYPPLTQTWGSTVLATYIHPYIFIHTYIWHRLWPCMLKLKEPKSERKIGIPKIPQKTCPIKIKNMISEIVSRSSENKEPILHHSYTFACTVLLLPLC